MPFRVRAFTEAIDCPYQQAMKAEIQTLANEAQQSLALLRRHL
jgi:hypothetical protein